jgi:hypothetical protein
MPLPDVARFTAVALVVSRHVINCLAGRDGASSAKTHVRPRQGDCRHVEVKQNVLDLRMVLPVDLGKQKRKIKMVAPRGGALAECEPTIHIRFLTKQPFYLKLVGSHDWHVAIHSQ